MPNLFQWLRGKKEIIQNQVYDRLSKNNVTVKTVCSCCITREWYLHKCALDLPSNGQPKQDVKCNCKYCAEAREVFKGDTRAHVSFNEIRAKIEQDFHRLMSILPEGDDKIIISEYAFSGQRINLFNETSPFRLLEEYARFVRDFHRRYSDAKEIKSILACGGMTAVLWEDTGPLYQFHLD